MIFFDAEKINVWKLIALLLMVVSPTTAWREAGG
jgi:hypothetical protein